MKRKLIFSVVFLLLLYSPSHAAFWSKEAPIEEQIKLLEQYIKETDELNEEAAVYIGHADKLLQNPTTRIEVYKALSDAYEASSETWQAFRKKKDAVPNDIRKDVRKKLSDGSDHYHLAYYSYRAFFKNMMDFIDTGSTKSQQKAIDERNDAHQYEIIAKAFFKEAREDLKK
jgi:hypothetical protein